MRKLSIGEWAAVGEIIAAAGVIASLLVVAYSINQNTKILQATNDNFLYEMQDTLASSIVDGPNIVPIRIKLENGEDLTQEEAHRNSWHMSRFLNSWELAFNRHRDGLLNDDIWQGWNRSFEIEVILPPLGMPKEYWDGPFMRDTYGADFADYVDSVYSRLLSEAP